VSPIFVRPVREQLEHDRLIRLLQAKYKRKFDVLANIGEERVAPVTIGPNVYYPDLVLSHGKNLACLVEVETGESVNNLEAMAQWTHFSHARVPFHLYVPVSMIDAARRLAEANRAHITELWTYRLVGDEFDFVRAHHDASAVAAAAKHSPKAPKPAQAAKPASAGTRPSARPAAKTARKPAPAKAVVKKPRRVAVKAGKSGSAKKRK
jgi:hypothetical protein